MRADAGKSNTISNSSKLRETICIAAIYDRHPALYIGCVFMLVDLYMF